MKKFNIGDRVRCKEIPDPTIHLSSGSGWEKGREFIVGRIEHHNIGNTNYDIYWGKENGSGVLGHALELSHTSWKDKYGGKK